MKLTLTLAKTVTALSAWVNFKSHGNCSPVAEYNYWCDPHAAQITFEKLGCKLEMVGLDVTRHIVLTPNHLEYMSRINAEMTAFITKITRFILIFIGNTNISSVA